MELLIVTSTWQTFCSEATKAYEELGLSMIERTLPCEASSISAKLCPDFLNRRLTAPLLRMNSMCMGNLKNRVKIGRPVSVGYVVRSMNMKADDLRVEKDAV